MAACDPPGLTLAVRRHLALPVDAVDRRGPGALPYVDHFVEPHGADFGGRHGQARQALHAAAELFLRAHPHVVLVLAGIKGRGHLPGDQRIQRLLDVEHRDPQVGGARPVDLQVNFGLSAAQRACPASTTSRHALHFASSAAEYLASLFRSGPSMKY